MDIGDFSNLPLNRLVAQLEPIAAGRFDSWASRDKSTISAAASRRDRARRMAEGGAAHDAAPDVRRTPYLSEEKRIAAQRIAQDMVARIHTLQELGLGYLSLDRSTPTLSSAGANGGGPPAGLESQCTSHTARYLFAADAPRFAQPRTALDWLELRNISRNNLHSLDVRFPLHTLTTVTGISGSGKSTLVSQALVELVAAALGQHLDADEEDTRGEDVTNGAGSGHIESGMSAIKRLVRVDQKPIGRTPRSNLATYTGLFDPVRKLFAATKAARARRYDAGRFSFNVAKGRCATCDGEGFVSVELLFMPSVYAPCSSCHGARYNEATLKITWRDKNIADVLRMSVDEASEFFADESAIAKPLRLLQKIGLGYLRLGQPATELSGGEAQRIKLVTELQRTQRDDTLYVLDEPTTGLHPADVDRLIAQLQELVEAGNSVVMVEHDLRVIALCDWVIDMGPGAGGDGGRIVAEGTPEAVSANPDSATGRYLHKYFR